MADMVMVSQDQLESLIDCSNIDDSSITSMDSTFDIVQRKNHDYPSLNTALGGDTVNVVDPLTASTGDYTAQIVDDGGDIYEKRIDIKQTKNMREQFQKKLEFYSEERVQEVMERVNARETLDDEEIENEVRHIEDMENNNANVHQALCKAAEISKQNLKEVHQVARNGNTTVKRAMDVIELALPVFVTAWSKSQEHFELNEEVNVEHDAFETARHGVIESGLDVTKRMQKVEEAQFRLRKATELAEADTVRVEMKKNEENALDRMSSISNTKVDIEHLISNQSEEIGNWLIQCKSDRDELMKFRQEQTERYETATSEHKKKQNILSEKIKLNRKQQDEFQRKLRQLESDERKLEAEKTFQQEVQKRANELNTDTCKEIEEQFSVIDGIEIRADTSRKVIELMTNCSKQLVSSSLVAEKDYLDKMSYLEKEAHKTLRLVLANDYIETKIRADSSSNNMSDCRQEMQTYSDKRKQAAKNLSALAAAKNKQLYEEYKEEYKREKATNDQAVKSLNELTKRLESLDEKLKVLGVNLPHINKLYELRLSEIDKQIEDQNSDMSSMEDNNSDDDFNDALA